jgi:hypothetical protein
MKPLNIFHTPQDWDEIMRWINRHAPEDRAHITTAAAMAWNLGAKIHNESLAE